MNRFFFFPQGKRETVPVLQLHLDWGPGGGAGSVHAPAQDRGLAGHAGAQGAPGDARGERRLRGKHRLIVLVVCASDVIAPSRSQFDLDHESLQESQENTLMIEEKAKPKQYYRFWVLPGKWLRVRYDRLALLALLDRWAKTLRHRSVIFETGACDSAAEQTSNSRSLLCLWNLPAVFHARTSCGL